MTRLEQAQAALADFLQKHPELVEMQNELDNAMNRCINAESRMYVIKIYLEDCLERLNDELKKLGERNV